MAGSDPCASLSACAAPASSAASRASAPPGSAVTARRRAIFWACFGGSIEAYMNVYQ